MAASKQQSDVEKLQTYITEMTAAYRKMEVELYCRNAENSYLRDLAKDSFPGASEWRCRMDEASNRVFWVNPQSNVSQWETPSIANPAEQGQRARSLSDATASDPKPEWEAAVDPKTGRTYYINSKTHQTTWNNPFASAQETDTQLKQASLSSPATRITVAIPEAIKPTKNPSPKKQAKNSVFDDDDDEVDDAILAIGNTFRSDKESAEANVIADDGGDVYDDEENQVKEILRKSERKRLMFQLYSEEQVFCEEMKKFVKFGIVPLECQHDPQVAVSSPTTKQSRTPPIQHLSPILAKDEMDELFLNYKSLSESSHRLCLAMERRLSDYDFSRTLFGDLFVSASGAFTPIITQWIQSFKLFFSFSEAQIRLLSELKFGAVADAESPNPICQVYAILSTAVKDFTAPEGGPEAFARHGRRDSYSQFTDMAPDVSPRSGTKTEVPVKQPIPTAQPQKKSLFSIFKRSKGPDSSSPSTTTESDSPQPISAPIVIQSSAQLTSERVKEYLQRVASTSPKSTAEEREACNDVIVNFTRLFLDVLQAICGHTVSASVAHSFPDKRRRFNTYMSSLSMSDCLGNVSMLMALPSPLQACVFEAYLLLPLFHFFSVANTLSELNSISSELGHTDCNYKLGGHLPRALQAIKEVLADLCKSMNDGFINSSNLFQLQQCPGMRNIKLMNPIRKLVFRSDLNGTQFTMLSSVDAPLYPCSIFAFNDCIMVAQTSRSSDKQTLSAMPRRSNSMSFEFQLDANGDYKTSLQLLTTELNEQITVLECFPLLSSTQTIGAITYSGELSEAFAIFSSSAQSTAGSSKSCPLACLSSVFAFNHSVLRSISGYDNKQKEEFFFFDSAAAAFTRPIDEFCSTDCLFLVKPNKCVCLQFIAPEVGPAVSAISGGAQKAKVMLEEKMVTSLAYIMLKLSRLSIGGISVQSAGISSSSMQSYIYTDSNNIVFVIPRQTIEVKQRSGSTAGISSGGRRGSVKKDQFLQAEADAFISKYIFGFDIATRAAIGEALEASSEESNELERDVILNSACTNSILPLYSLSKSYSDIVALRSTFIQQTSCPQSMLPSPDIMKMLSNVDRSDVQAVKIVLSCITMMLSSTLQCMLQCIVFRFSSTWQQFVNEGSVVAGGGDDNRHRNEFDVDIDSL